MADDKPKFGRRTGSGWKGKRNGKAGNRVSPQGGAKAKPPITGPKRPFPTVQHDLPELVVSFEHTRSTRQRYFWLFDNMVVKEPQGAAAGDTVAVVDTRGRFLGSAIYNTNSRIRGRVFSVGPLRFDEEYCRRAVADAVQRRRMHYGADESYRVIFADSDRLPGVIADLMAGVLVVQLLTYAADRYGEVIIGALREHLAPRATLVRRDAAVRLKEGLLVVAEPEIQGAFDNPVAVKQDGFTVLADLLGGQKTGLFLDQRRNRQLIRPYCRDARVLDLFCYVGAWAFSAAHAGAREVLGIDVSNTAVELARKGAEANGYTQVSFEATDAFDFVTEKAKGDNREKYDVVICDPPAFAKTAQRVNEAIKGYLSLNYRCMKLLPVGGVLATSSCSQHVSVQEFEAMLGTAARNANMQFQVLARAGQPPDHPVLLGFPESEYLKCFLLQRIE